jgi:hypothetical protein
MPRPFQFKNNYLNRKGKGRSGATLWHTRDFDSTPRTVPYYWRRLHERGEQHRPARGEGATGPAQVQRGWVAVADGLLARRGSVDRLQWQADLDPLLARSLQDNP